MELEKVALLVQLVGVAVEEREDTLQLGQSVLADLHDGRLVRLDHGQRARGAPLVWERVRVRARRVFLVVEACGGDGERGRVWFLERRGRDGWGRRQGRGGGCRGGRGVAAVESIPTDCGGTELAELRRVYRARSKVTYPHSDMKERTAHSQRKSQQGRTAGTHAPLFGRAMVARSDGLHGRHAGGQSKRVRRRRCWCRRRRRRSAAVKPREGAS